MADTTTVTFKDVLNGTDYQARPGVQYEIAEGVIVTMKRPTTKLLKDFDTYGQEAPDGEDASCAASDVKDHFQEAGEHFTDTLLAKAKMVTNAPESFDWLPEQVDPIVLQRLVDDFLSFSLVRSRMLNESSSAPSPPNDAASKPR